MEFRTISSLLLDQPIRRVQAIITHFEFIHGYKDDHGIPLALVLLSLTFDGVCYSNAVVIRSNEDEIQQFIGHLDECYKNSLALFLHFSVPSSDDSFIFPILSPGVPDVPAEKEGS